MADLAHIPDEAETRARWGNFAWTPANAKAAAEIVAQYPPGRQASASIPLLDLAQRQVGQDHAPVPEGNACWSDRHLGP